MTAFTRILWRASATALLLGVIGCAKGSSTLDDTANGTGGASGGSGTCGNGTLDTGEQCDGQHLNNQTCETMNFSSGMLLCSSDCKYDTQMCSKGSSGSGGQSGH